MNKLYMNNIYLHYAGYTISIAQHNGTIICQEFAYWKGNEDAGGAEIRHYARDLRYFISTLQVVMEDIDRLNSGKEATL